MGIDLRDFYLNTPMEMYEYMLIPINMIPPNTMEEYKLHNLVHTGMILTEIQKGMYGLPQARRLAYEKLVKHLSNSGYLPAKHTSDLFRYKTRDVTFYLIVDDFGIKYIRK